LKNTETKLTDLYKSKKEEKCIKIKTDPVWTLTIPVLTRLKIFLPNYLVEGPMEAKK
jgi:hypothetical protein